jgi:hypothetical protein
MVNNNNNLIVPKENLAQVEEVREINNEIPSFEEFVKTYKPSEEVEILTEAEYQDRLLHGPQFGPGNQHSRDQVKIGTGVGMAVLTFVCPPAGLAVGGGLLGSGAALVAVGHSADEQELKDFGLSMMSSGATGVKGGLEGLESHSGKDCSLPACPKRT